MFAHKGMFVKACFVKAPAPDDPMHEPTLTRMDPTSPIYAGQTCEHVHARQFCTTIIGS